MVELTGDFGPIEIAPGYFLSAPGLSGRTEEIPVEESATRSDSGLHEESLLRALEAADITTELAFELAVFDDRYRTPDEVTRAIGSTATTREGEPAIELEMPELGADTGYAILYSDETGAVRWIFPEEQDGTGEATRGGGGSVVFHLPRGSAEIASEDEKGEARRGPIAKLGRRVVRILTWATDGLVGKSARAIARAWEEKNRAYGIARVTSGEIGGSVEWDRFRGQRGLLLIHGTFSTAEAAFTDLIRSDSFKALAEARYHGRVIAFNHPSLHQSPDENVQALLARLPADHGLELDIVTHSRGGLVGRALSGRLNALNQNGVQLNVPKVVLVAAPNRGTILADGHNWLDLIDRYTNLLTELEDNPFTLTIEGILALVKIIGHGALKGLPGLHCMLPGGDYLDRLNRSPTHGTTYYAITANFTPDDENLLRRFGKRLADKVVDRIFEADNDGVVPTAGSYSAGRASPGFPIPANRLRVYGREARVHHNNYFAHAPVNRQLCEWLMA